MVKKTFRVDGMHCSSCAMLIEGELEDIGVAAQCSWVKQKVDVAYDPTKRSDAEIREAVARAGYRVVEEEVT